MGALLLARLALLVPLALAPAEDPPAVPASAPAKAVAARCPGAEVTLFEFDRLALARHAMSETGRAALKHLVRAEVLDQLATESGLEVPAGEIDARWREIEAQVVASGEGRGMADYLRRNRVTPETMRRFLRLGVVQEVLSRRALGIPDGRPVPGEQQEMWLDQVMSQRGEAMPSPPWKGEDTGGDPVVARCGEVEVLLSEYTPHLRTQIAESDVREDCYQLLLVQRMRARMPDLAPEALEAAIDAEIARRKAAFASDPSYQGLSYEQVLAAQGQRLDRLRDDPAIVVAALLSLWIERTHGDEGLREAYRADREWFDARFGEAVELSVLFLQAAVLTNDLNPRSFDDAELELRRMAAVIDSAEAFVEMAKKRSEDPGTREEGGRLGYVTAADESVPEVLRRIAFERPDSGLTGPVRLSSGVVLMWIGPRRPAPGWDVMSAHVDNELRRRLVEEVLPKESVTTWLDRD